MEMKLLLHDANLCFISRASGFIIVWQNVALGWKLFVRAAHISDGNRFLVIDIPTNDHHHQPKDVHGPWSLSHI